MRFQSHNAHIIHIVNAIRFLNGHLSVQKSHFVSSLFIFFKFSTIPKRYYTMISVDK